MAGEPVPWYFGIEYMGKIILTLSVIIVIALLMLFVFYSGTRVKLAKRDLTVKDKIFKVEIADTMGSREQGLSGRKELGPDEGMFFLFPFKSKYGFWMKEMNFPIDIVWVRGDAIAGFSKNAEPQPGAPWYKLKIYYPPEKIDKVLEVNAGTADKYGWTIGDKALLQ